MNRSMPGLPDHHQLLELTQTHVHRVADALQETHKAKSQGLSPITREELSSASNHMSEQESGSSPVKP